MEQRPLKDEELEAYLAQYKKIGGHLFEATASSWMGMVMIGMAVVQVITLIFVIWKVK